jgi:hypothetical protein
MRWSEVRSTINRGFSRVRYGDGDGIDAGAKDVIGVMALVVDDCGCCWGDGDGHALGSRDSPVVWAKVREVVWLVCVRYARTGCGRYRRSAIWRPRQRMVA